MENSHIEAKSPKPEDPKTGKKQIERPYRLYGPHEILKIEDKAIEPTHDNMTHIKNQFLYKKAMLGQHGL